MFSPVLSRGGVFSPVLSRGGVFSPVLSRGGVFSPVLSRGGVFSSVLSRGGVFSSVLSRGGVFSAVLKNYRLGYKISLIAGIFYKKFLIYILAFKYPIDNNKRFRNKYKVTIKIIILMHKLYFFIKLIDPNNFLHFQFKPLTTKYYWRSIIYRQYQSMYYRIVTITIE